MEKEGKTVVAVTAEGMLLGLLGIADRIHPEAEDAVAALRAEGIRCRMLTGDRPSTARAVADAVGITDVDASLLPEDKEAIVRKESEVCDVAMVGDGINDAPSLVRATVGIAIGAGTETAIEAADVVLSGSSPMGIAEAVEISRATLRIIRQNLFWALFYNALCIPIAAGVLYPVFGWQLSPMLASAAMSLSSVTVVSNALRLKHITLTKGDKMMFGRNKEKKNCTACAVASTYEIAVGGMMCPRCVAHVKTALEGVAGVTEVTVSLEEAKATVTASGTSLDVLLDAVRKAGYEASEK
jgi:Cu2+-exporting ATPase